jgi:hypothetical protein
LYPAHRKPNRSIGLRENWCRSVKRNRKKVTFLTADQLEEQADGAASEAKQLPDGEAKQDALRSAAQLRVYATMKARTHTTNRQIEIVDAIERVTLP